MYTNSPFLTHECPPKSRAVNAPLLSAVHVQGEGAVQVDTSLPGPRLLQGLGLAEGFGVGVGGFWEF